MTMSQMITKSDLEDMFKNILDSSGWDISGDMLWGYFFESPSDKSLEDLAKQLVADDYDLVNIYQIEPEDDNHEVWILHVEKIERHSVDSLYERNALLYNLAQKCPEVKYDGMDVGPIL